MHKLTIYEVWTDISVRSTGFWLEYV